MRHEYRHYNPHEYIKTNLVRYKKGYISQSGEVYPRSVNWFKGEPINLTNILRE